MNGHDMGLIDRRLALGGGLAAAAGLAWPRAQIRGRVVTQRGIAGGGLVAFAEGEAEFSLFASSFTFAEDGSESEPVFLGGVRWIDGSVGLTLESVQITRYENLHLTTGEGRRIEGIMDAGESGEPPFSLELYFDFPASAADRVVFRVGVASAEDAATPAADLEFTYSADGDITVGGVQEADFAVDVVTGAVTEPPPQ